MRRSQPSQTPSIRRRNTGVGLLAALLVVVVSPQVLGDDRLLFQSATAEPYVMTLIDTSGSMALDLNSPAFSDGNILTLRGSADDPSSRLYLAKSALFEVIKGLRPGVQLGFARFNQRDFSVDRKHWLYQRDQALTDADIPWFAEVPFPAAGAPIQFGHPTIDNFQFKSCNNPDNARGPGPDDAWRINRVNIFPKLGHDGTTNTTLYTRQNNRTYEIRVFGMAASELGKDSIDVEIRVRQVNDDCDVVGINLRETLTFKPLYTQDNEGVPFRGGFDYLSINASGPGSTGTPVVHNYNLGNIFDADDYENCPGSSAGWDSNYDNAHALSFPESPDPLNRGCANNCFDRGDVLPWDWTEYPRQPVDTGYEFNSRDEVLRRMAPNVFVTGEFDKDANGDPIPDFRIARYFEDEPSNGRLALKSQFANTPPMAVARLARTPLARQMQSFGSWFDDWERVASDADDGDPNYDCREKYVILLTDGVETCSGSPSAAAGSLRGKGVRVFAVGFGPGVDFGELQAIANNGGTGTLDTNGDGTMDCAEFDICPGPVLAANRQALIDSLNHLFGSIEPDATSFASAAVPQAQAEAQDSIFLTNFVPLDGKSVWPGSLLQFSRPLPLIQNADGQFIPDVGKSCDGLDPKVSCLAWDAGEKLLTQAPDTTEVTTNLRLGNGTDQRRVYFVQDNLGSSIPATKRFFQPPTAVVDKYDLWSGLGIQFTVGDQPSEDAAAIEAEDIIERTLVKKTATDPQDPNQTIEYVMGDIFHADPVVVGGPERFEYFIDDVGSNNKDCDDVSAPNPGYRCFFVKHRRRRKVVFGGSNDGELHAFDAGFFTGQVVDGRIDGEFDLGTGQELFAYIPRPVLPGVKKIAQGRNQEFNVDGPPISDDVFIDPIHTGTPTVTEREWRSVLIAGLREGGSGYFAVDVTQPDHLDTPAGQNPNAAAQQVPNDQGNYVPSCLAGYTSAACGPVPYPSVLWEFSDTSDEDTNASGNFDGADLAFTWSRPNTGRIRVIENSTIVDKYVAIFGGGMPENDSDGGVPNHLNDTGDWLYIVDIETGKTIYKRELMGSAPSEPAAVDTDQDGILDTIYIGTTLGFLYKVDVSTPVDLVDTNIAGIGKRIQDTAWDPFVIFDTGGRPIFYPPSVIFVTQLGRFALAFGTGYREDLWLTADPPQEGRFYMILDNGFSSATSLTEAAYQTIALNASPGGDFLLDPSAGTGSEHGWYLVLEPNERVITKTFSVAGVTIFSSFSPDAQNPVVGGLQTCARAGASNIYTVFTSSANGVGAVTRFRTIEGFVSNPFTELSATKKSDSQQQGHTSDDLTDALRGVRDTLKGLFPRSCKFATSTLNVKTIRSDTGVEFIAPIPKCVIQKNWKEW